MNRLAFASALLLSCGLALGQYTLDPVPATPATPAPAAQPKPAAKPKTYDETADARKQIAAAVAHAKKENRRVLIQWGGNWCGWCHLLHDKMKSDKALAREMLYEYDLVLVDVDSKAEKNADLGKQYGADFKKGFPYLTILDGNGKVLANEETEQFETKPVDGQDKKEIKPGHDAEKLLAFLKKHEATPLQADAVLKDAMDQAKASGRSVFVHFGAPWCGWCKRLEAWLEKPEVGPLFAKDYVEVKIDQDRMVGGKELESKYGMPSNSGIPWFVFLDPASGKPLADATGPKGNVGFPYEPFEIDHFVTALQKTRKNLTESDIAKLKSTLGKDAEPSGAH